MSHFKIFFSQNNIRRFNLTQFPSYSSFISLLKEIYPSQLISHFTIKYTDTDGDQITITSQIEWEEMERELGSGPYKLIIQSDTTTLQEKIVQDETVQEKEPKIAQNEQSSGITKSCWLTRIGFCLKKFFNDSKSDCSESLTKCKNKGLAWIYHHWAVHCLQSLDENVIKEGKLNLLKIIEMFPDDNVALFNLACADSILENRGDALKYLEEAIGAGFCDLDHLLNDKDLDNVKGMDGFNLIVRKLEDKLSGNNHCKGEEKDELENNVEVLIQMGFDLPMDVIKDILRICGGNLEEAITMILMN
jgi:hypothetical protein